jgi:hypothetical protein
MKFGKFSVLDAEKAIKKGNFEPLNEMFNFNGVISKEVRGSVTNEVKNLPSYKVGRLESKVNNIATSKVDDVLKLKRDLTPDEVLKTSSGTKIVDYLKNKSFTSLTLGTVTIGVTATAVVAYVNRHRDKMSGCYKYTNTRGVVTACKVLESSCKDGVNNLGDGAYSNCTDVPLSMKKSSCVGTIGYACINCPTQEVEDELRGSINDADSLDVDETIYYQCNSPSFFDAVGDIVNNKIDELDNLLNTLKSSASGIFSWFAKNIKYIGIAFVIAIILAIFAVFYSFTKKLGITEDREPLVEK